MPIPAEFSKYKNEAEFTEQFLIPLLHRMGFSVVVNYHGRREFGKDLVFGEIDAFGHVRYHGLQAQFASSISQSDELIEDCNKAFGNPFTHPETGSEERINSFYAANGGSIPDNSRTTFLNALATPHGGHIWLLDGQDLVALDRLVPYRNDENITEVLTGLRLECQYNANKLACIIRGLKSKLEDDTLRLTNDRLRTLALGNYLVKPFALEGLAVNRVHDTWHRAEKFNRLLDAIPGVATAELRHQLMQDIVRNFEIPLREDFETLLSGIAGVLQTLEPSAAP